MDTTGHIRHFGVEIGMKMTHTGGTTIIGVAGLDLDMDLDMALDTEGNIF